MTDGLLPYYNAELAFLRLMADDFSRSHQQVAVRLGLKSGVSSDPHIERLLQGVAFLNARMRRKLDDDFPELAEAMLGVIYPHYVRPIPSMGIVELSSHPTDAPQGYDVPMGTELVTSPEPESGKRCTYRTCYPVRLWPLKVEVGELRKRPFQAPQTSVANIAESVLRIRLATLSPAIPISKLRLRSVRFYLHAGPGANVYRLFELLFTKTLQICVARAHDAPQFHVLQPGDLQEVGFAQSEGLLPWDRRSFLGYRLLAEYFAFPQKFLFFDLDLNRLGNALESFQDALEIYFFLDTADENLQRHVTANTFRLGATPIINLFTKKCQPFVLDQHRTEYLIEPAARSVASHEIYAIDSVQATSPDSKTVRTYQPFYSFKHATRPDEASEFWHATWRPSSRASTASRVDRGRDVYMSFLDLQLNPAQAADWTIRVHATCTNRDLPSHLPTGTGIDLSGGRGSVKTVSFLHPPTATLRLNYGKGAIWRFISHLSLNHLSLTGGEDGAAALREILLLYDYRGSLATRSAIDGIRSIHSRRVTRRLGLAMGGFGRGVQVRIMLDESKFSDEGAYLFATVLDRFLALYANINSFTETIVQCEQRVDQEEPWKWKMRAGQQVLL